MNIKLISQKPHKKYEIEVSGGHIKELCEFLSNQKDRQLEITLNGKNIKFNSIAGRKRYASGLEQGAYIVDDQVAIIWREHLATIDGLKAELGKTKQELHEVKQELNETRQKYATKYTVMNLRKAAWEDYIAELEDDRAILKAVLNTTKRKDKK